MYLYVTTSSDNEFPHNNEGGINLKKSWCFVPNMIWFLSAQWGLYLPDARSNKNGLLESYPSSPHLVNKLAIYLSENKRKNRKGQDGTGYETEKFWGFLWDWLKVVDNLIEKCGKDRWYLFY